MTLLSPSQSPIDSFVPSKGGVRVSDGYLTRDVASQLYLAFADVQIPSSLFYIGRDVLDDRECAVALLGEYLPWVIAEAVVSHLIRLLDFIPGEAARQSHGFEIWTSHSYRTEHNNCYLHIDNDEALRTSAGTVRAPLIGTILHLGPDSGLVGGETLFTDDHDLCLTHPPFQFHDWTTLTANPERVQVVEQRAGRLVVFDGQLAHGRGPVLDHPEQSPRIVFLANLWGARIGDVPEGICPLSPRAFKEGGTQ